MLQIYNCVRPENHSIVATSSGLLGCDAVLGEWFWDVTLLGEWFWDVTLCWVSGSGM